MKNSEIDITRLTDDEKFNFIMNDVMDLASDLPRKEQIADVIVVLGARPKALKARIKKALELYALGYSDKILITGARGFARENLACKKEQTIDELEEIFKKSDNTLSSQELYELTEAELGKKMLYELDEMKEITEDMPKDENIMLEKIACTTKGNAYNTKEMLNDNGININRIILVSSSYHVKRGILNFETEMNNTEFIGAPTTEDLYAKGIDNFDEMRDIDFYKRQFHMETDAIINYSKKGFIIDKECDMTFNYELDDLIDKEFDGNIIDEDEQEA